MVEFVFAFRPHDDNDIDVVGRNPGLGLVHVTGVSLGESAKGNTSKYDGLTSGSKSVLVVVQGETIDEVPNRTQLSSEQM